MKKLLALCITGLWIWGVSRAAWAQAPDTVDVPQGFETLNLAIQGDTTATGYPVNPNRVYRLERGGYYLLNGSITGVKGAPVRIIAAEGEGPMPIIIPAVTEAGASVRAFNPKGDGYWKGLYVSGIDNLGNAADKNMFRLDKKGGRYIVDHCFLDYDAQSFFRMNAANQKLYITNTILRNSYLLADPGNGRFIDTRANTQDTIFVQNSTLYTCSSEPLRSGGGIILNCIFDHVTMYQVAGDFGEMQTGRTVNLIFTNNLLVDFGYEGRTVGDTLGECMIQIDTLRAPDIARDEDRVYVVRNNVMGWTPEVQAWIDSKDSLEVYPFFDQRTARFFATYPKMVEANNIIEYPVFSDPPDPAVIVAYADHRFATNYSNENNPDIAADRNGRGVLSENPETMGPAPDEFDFDYRTSSVAYTHAEGGFPVGDLNWFPQKKAEWEVWVRTGVGATGSAWVPARFALEQNYPNPFNLGTTIRYRLTQKTPVRLLIVNSAGRTVRELVNHALQGPGTYTVTWDGRDDAGRIVSTGLYFCKLQAEGRTEMRKMLLLK
ncbi:MAG: T9SS type A sorting domain-containing protein [candidate division KSB1 bacterium]|nr:T9SS type A sorting domain-containing protein [candidate division KSB1 bacterium]